jgi:hypothetical protein
MKTQQIVAKAHSAERRLRVMDDPVHDPYQEREKLAEPTRCPQCNAAYVNGRWRWDKVPARAHETLCPACRRIRDRFPAGFVTLEGAYAAAHRDELLQLVRNIESREKAEHPYQRIMDIEQTTDRAAITTTDIRLARTIGEGLRRAHDGELHYRHEKGKYLLRVGWRR